MPTPFDATTKTLVDLAPGDWLNLLGLPFERCAVIDSDLATVSTEADRLIEALGEPSYVAHLEFQTGHDGAAVPERLLRYNSIALMKTGKPVLSFVLLLRPDADSPRLTGQLTVARPNGSAYLSFEYGVMRLWQVPVESILRAGLATLPLALLADFAATTPEQVVAQMEARLETEAPAEAREELWATTYLLSGVRFSPEESLSLLRKAVAQMKESSTYQQILLEGLQVGRQEGRLEGILAGERDAFLRIAIRRLGPPDSTILGIVEKASLPRLQSWMDQVIDAESWQELLAQ